MHSTLAPLQPLARVHLIDALRGFALLGILLINLGAFSLFWGVPAEQKAALSTVRWDQGTQFLLELFVRGKFYSLFSLLFGLGFAIQMLRAEERGDDFLPVFQRRLMVLAGIGFVHIAFVWDGDILLLYALLGFLLIPFRRASDRTLLVTATALIASPILIDTVIMLSGGRLDPGAPLLWIGSTIYADWFGYADTEEAWMQHALSGGLGEFLRWSLPGPFYRYADLLSTSRIPKVFAMFLVGLWLGRRQLFRDIETHRAMWRRLFVWGLVLGLPANLALAWLVEVLRVEPFTPAGLMATTAYAAGVAPLALAYAAGFALLWRRPRWAMGLSVLAPVGRMALTNYIVQSVICIGIFYGIGLGLGGRVSPVYFPLLALSLFAVQAGLSHAWLRWFRFGPLEWLWRSLTYRQWQPLRMRRDESKAGGALNDSRHQVSGIRDGRPSEVTE